MPGPDGFVAVFVQGCSVEKYILTHSFFKWRGILTCVQVFQHKYKIEKTIRWSIYTLLSKTVFFQILHWIVFDWRILRSLWSS